MSSETATLDAPAKPAAPAVTADGTSTTAPPERVRDATGKFAAKPDVMSDEAVTAQLAKEFPDLFKGPVETPQEAQASAAAKETAAIAEDKSKAAEAAKEPEPDKALTKAIDVLKRAKLPASTIEKMDRDEKINAAKELRGLVVEGQKNYNRLVELEKATGKSIAGGEPATGSAKAESPRSSLREALEPWAKVYGEEAVEPLEKSLAPIMERLEKAERHLERSAQTQTQRVLKEARGALVERFPQLEDDDDFNEAFPIMVKLESTGLFDTNSVDGMKELITQAAGIARWTPIESRQKTKETDETFTRLRDNGTASSKSKPAVQTAAKTKDEKQDLAAQLAQDPSISVEEARRRVHGS